MPPSGGSRRRRAPPAPPPTSRVAKPRSVSSDTLYQTQSLLARHGGNIAVCASPRLRRRRPAVACRSGGAPGTMGVRPLDGERSLHVMLKALRDNIRHLHWILWVVIVTFIALAFGGLGRPEPWRPQHRRHRRRRRDHPAGLKRQYRNLEQRYSQMFGDQWSPELAEQLGLGRQALEQLINRQVLIEEARRLGIEVSDDEVRHVHPRPAELPDHRRPLHRRRPLRAVPALAWATRRRPSRRRCARTC